MFGKINRSAALLSVLVVCYTLVLTSPFRVDPDAQFIIPQLLDVDGPADYISRLFSFRTIDFQPVRDLSLFGDVLFYRLWNLNTLVFFNVLIWWVSCLVVLRIWKFLFPDIPESRLFLIVLGFSVYPLFSQSVVWGMARKHLLAFLFITLATEAVLKDKKRSVVFYALSVLSQPITLLWPVWACLRDKSNWRKVTPSLFLMGVLGAVNFYYYQSESFRKLYGTKTNELFTIPEKLLATGHYFFQLLFPYLLGLSYHLGHWSTLVGLFLLVITVALFLKFPGDKPMLLSWSVFSILPLIVVLAKASFLYDTYLLVSGFGFFTLLISQFQSSLGKVRSYLLLAPVILWSCLTTFEASLWRDEHVLSRANFLRRPGCKSAFQHMKSSYESGVRPDPEARVFLRDHDCTNVGVSPMDVFNVDASMAYYEPEGDPDQRIERLQRLSSKGIYPQLLLTALLIDFDRKSEANEEIQRIVDRWGTTKFRPVYIPVVQKVIHPYCSGLQNRKCLELLAPFKDQVTGIVYR